MAEYLLDGTPGEMVEVTGAGDDCNRCAGLETLIAGLHTDLKMADRENKAKGRKIAALEAELKEQRQEAPEGQIVRACFNGWVRATGRNPKTTKLGPAREKAILARVREQNPERVMRAVTIGVRGANTSNREAEREALIHVMNKAMELVPPEEAAQLRAEYKRVRGRVKVYDDIELICRDEIHVERFADLADTFDPQSQTPDKPCIRLVSDEYPR